MEMLYWWVRQRGCEHGKTRAAIQRDANTIPGRNTRMFSIYFLWYRSWKQASSTANQKLGFSEGAGPKSSHAVPARRDWLLSPPLLQAFVPSRAVVCMIESRCGEATRFQLSNKGWKLHLQMKSWHLAWSSSLPSLCYNYLGHEEGENSAKLTDLPPPPSPRTKTSEDIFKKSLIQVPGLEMQAYCTCFFLLTVSPNESYLRWLLQVFHTGDHSCSPACSGVVASPLQQEIGLIRFSWSIALLLNHLSFTRQHF